MAKTTPSSEIERNLRIYRELSRLDPENDHYKKKVTHYQVELDATNQDRPAPSRRLGNKQNDTRPAGLARRNDPSPRKSGSQEVSRLMQIARDAGIIRRMDMDAHEYWVDGAYWRSLSYEEKRSIALMCSEYDAIKTGDGVIGVMDDRTGKELAMFGPRTGFKPR